MRPSAGFYHFQQQQAMDYKFGLPQGRQGSSTPKLLASSCSWSTGNQQTVTESGYPQPQYGNPTPMNNYAGYSNTDYQQFPQNQMPQACFPQEQIRYPPRPTIPLDRFGNYRAACQSENFCPAESYQRYTDVGHVGNFNMLFQNQQKSAFQLPCKEFREQPPYQPEIKGYPESLGELPKEYLTTLMGEKTYSVDPKESQKALEILRKPVERDIVEQQAKTSQQKPAPKYNTEPVTEEPKPEVKEEVVVKTEKIERSTPCASSTSTEETQGEGDFRFFSYHSTLAEF